MRRHARQGLFVGWSAGAAIVAAERLPASPAVVAVIGPDSGMRYLSDHDRLSGAAP